MNEKVDVHEPYVIGELLIYGNEEDEPGVSIHSYYNAGSPSLKLYGSENNELVRLTGLANPTANNDAATKQYVDILVDSLNAEDVGGAQESLKLTATPTSGPSGTTLMSGTWSGATWEEVMAAVLASRLIQFDVAGIGTVTLLYNANGATSVQSECFTSGYKDTYAIVYVTLFSDNIFVANIASLVDPGVYTVEGSVVDIQPLSNTIYNCGELASLTINNPPATGKYSIIFFSGATATNVTGIDNFNAEANKRYKITVEDNYATYDSWPYTQK